MPSSYFQSETEICPDLIQYTKGSSGAATLKLGCSFYPKQMTLSIVEALGWKASQIPSYPPHLLPTQKLVTCSKIHTKYPSHLNYLQEEELPAIL